MTASTTLATAFVAIVAAVLKLVAASDISFYDFSRVNALKGGFSYVPGASRLQCALECFSGGCARFVYSGEGCWLYREWEADGGSVRFNATVENVEYKLKGICPQDFFYHATFQRCFLMNSQLITNWDMAMTICMGIHPSATLVIVEDYNQAIFFQTYLRSIAPVSEYGFEDFWTGGRLSVINYMIKQWWRVRNNSTPFLTSEIWQLHNPVWDNKMGCISVGSDVVGMENKDCADSLPFVCQVNAMI